MPSVTGPSGPLAAGENLEIWGLRENPSLVDGEGSRRKSIDRIQDCSRPQGAVNEVVIVGPSSLD